MKIICKYHFQTYDQVAGVRMPKGAVILHAHEQVGFITLWAKIDDQSDYCSRLIHIFGTGRCCDHVEELPYIGTVHIDGHVWHLFDGGEV